MNTATKSNYDQKRAKLIQLAHIAANELGLLDPKRHETDPEDEYHLILKRWYRPGTRQPVTSSLQMSTAQLDELLLFFKGLGFKVKRKSGDADKRESGTSASTHQRMYASSLTGLKDEICDLAKKRWGQGSSSQGQGGEWELPLNNFCIRFGVKRWQWLDVNHGKAVKEALVRLQNINHPSPTSPADGRGYDKQEAPF